MPKYTAEDIINRLNSLEGKRSTLDNHLQEVCDFVLPRKATITNKDRTPGSKYRIDTYDSTAILDNEYLASGMYSYLTPPNKLWFQIRKKSKNGVKPSEQVRRYFTDVTNIIYGEIASSNFALQMNESYLDLGWAGIAGLILEEAKATSPSCLSFKNLHYTTYYIMESNSSVVDTLFRKFKLFARQAIQEFGDDCSQDIKDAAADSNKNDKEFEFIHCIYPRTDIDPTKLDRFNMPWASVYIDVKAKQIIKEGGYNEQPFMTPRFAKDNFEIYGRSPAMAVLSEIKMCNAMVKTIIAAGQKVVDPPWLVPDNNSFAAIRTTPGALIYYNAANPANKPEPLQTGAQIGLGIDLLSLERDVIHKAFMVDLFSMLQNQTQQMTATEVLARLEEKITMFAPTFGRLTTELFDPMIARAYGICQRAGKLPEPPEELIDDMNYDIEYTSKLALAMKSLELKSTFEFFDYIKPLVEADPSIVDNIDFDAVVQIGADKFNIPTEFVRSTEQVMQIRQQRAEAQQAQQQMEMASKMADSVPKLSKRPEQGSPISELTNF